MGEMADDIIGDLFDRMGEDDEYEYYTSEKVVECKHCGTGGLHWTEDGKRWRLATAHGLLHRCPTDRVHKAALDDFDVL